MQSFRSLFALLVLAWPYFLTAQEVKYIDISNVRLRTELRHPPPPPAECKAGACIGGGSWPLEPVFARLRGSFWLRRNTFRAQSGGTFTEIHNLYPNETPTPSIPVHLLSGAARRIQSSNDRPGTKLDEKR